MHKRNQSISVSSTNNSNHNTVIYTNHPENTNHNQKLRYAWPTGLDKSHDPFAKNAQDIEKLYKEQPNYPHYPPPPPYDPHYQHPYYRPTPNGTLIVNGQIQPHGIQPNAYPHPYQAYTPSYPPYAPYHQQEPNNLNFDQVHAHLNNLVNKLQDKDFQNNLKNMAQTAAKGAKQILPLIKKSGVLGKAVAAAIPKALGSVKGFPPVKDPETDPESDEESSLELLHFVEAHMTDAEFDGFFLWFLSITFINNIGVSISWFGMYNGNTYESYQDDDYYPYIMFTLGFIWNIYFALLTSLIAAVKLKNIYRRSTEEV